MEDGEFKISGKVTGVFGLILIVAFVALRMATFSDSADEALEEAVRAELWLRYGSRLGAEINEIRETANYDAVSSLLKKSSPKAITIEEVKRSEPLLSWSSNQTVIVRVQYRYPEDTETQQDYMEFTHGPLGGWRYMPGSAPSAVSYYLNFF